MRSSEVDGGHRPKANRINNVLSEYRKKFNMQPWKPSRKSPQVLQNLIDSGEIRKPSSGNSTRGISPGPKNPSRPWNRKSGRNYVPYPPGFDPDQFGSWNPWADYKHLCRKREKRTVEAESDCGDRLTLSDSVTRKVKTKGKSCNTRAESDSDDDDNDDDDDVLPQKSKTKSPHTPLSQQFRFGNLVEARSPTSRLSNEHFPDFLVNKSCGTLARIQTGDHVKAPCANMLLSPPNPQEELLVISAQTALNSTLHRPNQDLLEELRFTSIRRNIDVAHDLHSAAGVHPDQLSQRYRDLDEAASENHNHYIFSNNDWSNEMNEEGMAMSP